MHGRHNLLILLLATMVPSSLAAIFPRQVTTTTSSSSSTTSTSATSVPTATTTSLPTESSVTLTSAAAVSSSAQPIVSVISGGSLTTIEPSGVSSAPVPTASSGLTNSTGGSNVTEANTPACTAANYSDGFAPFCLPTNGSAWIKDTSYPITWDPSFWPGYSGNVVLAVLYTGKDGSNVITQNSSIPNVGFYKIDIQDSWLNGNDVVAAQLLIATDEVTQTNGGAHYGPIVTIQVSADPFDKTPPTFNSKSLAVVIAVPIAVVVIILMLFAICFFSRKNRRLPEGLRIPRNGGRSNRGYAEGRSRRARTVGVEKNNDEFELTTVSGYHDEPSAMYSDDPEQHNTRREIHDDH